jgi:hypothetical protein
MVSSTTTELVVLIPQTIVNPMSPLTENSVGPSLNIPFSIQQTGRTYPYGMPTAMMTDLYTNPSMFYDNALGPFSPVRVCLVQLRGGEGLY